MLITIIAGTRPNFMNIAPIIHQINKKKEGSDIDFRLIHSGQHYDKKLNGTFFNELNIPKPNKSLGVGSGTQAEQTAGIMIAFEKELVNNYTDLVIVVGDVTSIMACAIVAKKLHTKVAHVEGGIRSFDVSIPEQINRMVTDSITDYFYVASDVAIKNLKKLGIEDDKIIFVENTMIDTLIANFNRLVKPLVFDKLSLKEKEYIVLTMHRPANVDEELKLFMEEIINSSNNLPIVFPAHPRTNNVLSKLNINANNMCVIDLLGYLEFNYLVKNAFCVITDSGGITEETTFMKVPCLTLRDNTERPETITIGTNELVGTNLKNIQKVLQKIFSANWKKGSIPKFWDGKTSERIIDHILTLNL
tara:strand:+ start:2301 stop:3383 length:1083 start_codon:yes stop_codon:yes gene_type:complete